jgi:hypothetical protein
MVRIALSVAIALISLSAYPQSSKVDWVVSVVLPETKPIDGERLANALQRRVTEQDKFTGVEGDKDIVLLRVGGGTAMVSLMDAPIPKGELQDICRFAWYWRAACDAVRGHKAHVLVVLMGTELNKLDSALLQTKIVAAIIEESDAVASYWGVNLQPRDVFLKGSARASRDSIPVTLWVNYRMSREPSGNFTLSTRGLKEFDLMEIETKDAPMPGLELFDLVLGATQYLIAKGPVIKDGDTIGQSPKQRIRVRHAESYWNAGEKVYRIEFGG